MFTITFMAFHTCQGSHNWKKQSLQTKNKQVRKQSMNCFIFVLQNTFLLKVIKFCTQN